MESVGTWAGWAVFSAIVLTLLAVDLGIVQRKAHVVKVREALIWTCVWVGLALLFCVGVHFRMGHERALEFLTAYLIEEALSVDNLFVFMVIFSYFSVPAALQHRVLFWGIFGAIVLRAIFIVIGAALLQKFHWIIYIFGGFLVFTGIKLLAQRGEEVHPERNPVLRLFRQFVPCVSNYRGAKFMVVEDGKRFATPLLMVLVVVEATDVVFAVDSIPAVFAVSRDPFIVYTSNVFAILGLRSMFFVLSGMLGKFHYLKVGLGLVLSFVGAKMLLADVYHTPIAVSLGVIVLLLAGSVVASLMFPRKEPPVPVHPPHEDAP